MWHSELIAILCTGPWQCSIFSLFFILSGNVDEVPRKLFTIKKQSNGLSHLILCITQVGKKIVHSIPVSLLQFVL
jgi:hypothetical protein